MLSDSLRKLLKSWNGIKTVDGTPMEAERVHCNPDEIDAYYNLVEVAINTLPVPASFIYNIGETGFKDWVDCRIERVVVPSSYAEDKIDIPVDRNSKRSTLLAVVSASGDTLKPMVILPRKTIEAELYEVGYTPDKVLAVYQENRLITTPLFELWAEEIFFPNVQKMRELLEYTGDAVLLMDGMSAHYSDHFLDECTYYGIDVIFIAPHSSDQCQPLDLGVFAIQKSFIRRVFPDKRFNPQTRQIVKILSAYQMATPHPNVIKVNNCKKLNFFINAIERLFYK